MSKHKKAHRTYPDCGKKQKKGKLQKQDKPLTATGQPEGKLEVTPKPTSHQSTSHQSALLCAEQLMVTPHLVTAESVRAGHPDKLCDQIADSILDAHLEQDKNAHVAVEVMATEGKIIIAGEVLSTATVNYHRIVYEQLGKIGYTVSDLSDDPLALLQIEVRVHDQSLGIAQAVEDEMPTDTTLADTIGAGDQGIMVGYATSETPECMPLPVVLAHNICKELDKAKAPWLGTDGKAQVTVLYHGDRPVAVTDIVVSFQHTATVKAEDAEVFILNEIISKAIPSQYLWDNSKLHINPSGCFIKGGPAADTGLTGRKLAVDAYGPVAHIGGGAMSGKDATKVDRTGAYAARWLAKNIVCAGLAKRCEVQIAYAIGQRKPVSVSIDTFGTAPVHDDVLINAVKKIFDLRPGALIEHLKLREVRYAPLAAYGHFGRTDLNMPWENADMVDALLSAVSDSSHHLRRADRYA